MTGLKQESTTHKATPWVMAGIKQVLPWEGQVARRQKQGRSPMPKEIIITHKVLVWKAQMAVVSKVTSGERVSQLKRELTKL
jgi:hypothetical protein